MFLLIFCLLRVRAFVRFCSLFKGYAVNSPVDELDNKFYVRTFCLMLCRVKKKLKIKVKNNYSDCPFIFITTAKKAAW